eukprot:gnl/TRDRNA2_/TRDRNA2_165979_c3_seq1.p1 gnl/TRDRNA2_/TRDRNA2_165979_c3~~gnl/TRDRNA2_/TRDRNA2_165979_c3_seq1.p1  ORF type:complete len:162 (+),score=20.73 gnl/TRDRNA2_/TRDRNA2_165979_c3_seq1:2-487(+)
MPAWAHELIHDLQVIQAEAIQYALWNKSEPPHDGKPHASWPPRRTVTQMRDTESATPSTSLGGSDAVGAAEAKIYDSNEGSKERQLPLVPTSALPSDLAKSTDTILRMENDMLRTRLAAADDTLLSLLKHHGRFRAAPDAPAVDAATSTIASERTGSKTVL